MIYKGRVFENFTAGDVREPTFIAVQGNCNLTTALRWLETFSTDLAQNGKEAGFVVAKSRKD